MDTNEKDLDVMTQEEIERFLEEQQKNIGKEEDVEADLASLLSELENDGDGDIQEISSLLNKADNNEAVAEDVVALMDKQEADSETAYGAMDLFSDGKTEKKEGFFQRLLNRHKQKKQEKVQKKEATKAEKAKVKEEKKAAKTKVKKEEKAVKEQKLHETTVEVDEALEALTVETLDSNKEIQKKKDKAVKEKKPKKEKKKKSTKSKDSLTGDGDESETKQEEQTKKKKGKEKKVKEKKSKKKNEDEELTSIREKNALQDAVEILEEESEETPNKKKILIVFVAAVMIMLGFLVVYFYFTGHANKKLAEEAYEAEDYLECYQLMYGQHLNDSQQAMFHRSELILKMDIFQKDYNEHVAKQRFLEALDVLVQFVYDYSELSAYATEWNCLEIVQDTYEDVIFVLAEDYTLTEQEVLDIAAIESDVEYTRALVELIEEKKRQDVWDLEYPDMLPPEQDRIMQSE